MRISHPAPSSIHTAVERPILFLSETTVSKTPTEHPASITRRSFLQRTGTTAVVVAAPLVIPSRLLGKSAPSNRIRVGHIGAGRIAQGHDMVGVAGADLADVLAVADLDSRRAASGKARVERLFATRNAPPQKIDVY